MSKNYFIFFYFIIIKIFYFLFLFVLFQFRYIFVAIFSFFHFFIKFIYINLFGRLLEIILNKVYLTILGFFNLYSIFFLNAYELELVIDLVIYYSLFYYY